jgi:hypothetical protein
MNFKEYLIKSDLFEAAYPGNLGAMEMFKFYNTATPEEKAIMDKIVAQKDWEAFKELIHKVLGIQLV